MWFWLFFWGYTLVYAKTSVYVWNSIYTQPNITVSNLIQSNVDTAIIWTVHVGSNGDMDLNMEFPLVQDGVYIGNLTHPDFETTIQHLNRHLRVELSLSASESPTFYNIHALISQEGTGDNTTLYKNFRALRGIFSILNFDQESDYDLDTILKFSRMLHRLNFTLTMCPYMNYEYWFTAVTRLNTYYPGLVDTVYVQVYAGGIDNDPCEWVFLNVDVSPGIDTEISPDDTYAAFKHWHYRCNISSGFLWRYEDTDLLIPYTKAINMGVMDQ